MVRGSSYLGSTPKSATGRPRRFGSIAAVLMVLAVFLSTFATIPMIDALTRSTGNTSASSNGAINEASAMWCADPKQGELGVGMNNRANWESGSAWYPHSDTSGRILTAQEAFGNGVKFTNFAGAGEGQSWFFMNAPLGLPEKDDDTKENLKSVVSYTGNTPKGDGTENWFKNMNSSRVPTKCVLGGAGTYVANGILGLSGSVTNLMGGISTFAFDPNFICEPNSPKGNCIDLVGIIGGAGKSDQGIIGKLTTSVYFPLLALVALLVGIYVLVNGILKRQFRETLIGALWSVIVTILGIGLLLNPLMLAKAPMLVGNALTSCVVGAFTGSGGCADNSGGTGTSDPQTAICEAWSSKTNFVDQASITMTSMGCDLWKAFVLQPYAQGAFGAPLDELDTSRSDTIAGKILAKNPGFKNDTFCVDTKVQGTLDSHKGNTLDLVKSGTAICNLAVYQAYLGVDAKMDTGAGGAPAAAGTVDARWLKVAQLAASDDGMYRSWAPSDMHLAQIGYASLGALSAFLAAIVVFVVSAFALAFYVTSILMIAFAPFFLLAGVHPGKGKKMMIGWIGQVLSNVMKYAASAIFLVITVALYSAVLANVTNPGAILIFMIILTVALLMYRKEIVDMIGVIDLGGEKLSNKFAEKTMDRVRNIGKTSTAVAAGVTAGALSNGTLNPFNKENWKPSNIREGLTSSYRAGEDSFRRSIKSRPGALGEVMKASDRISADNRADMVKQSTAVTDEAKSADTTLQNSKREHDGAVTSLADLREKSSADLEKLRLERAQADDAKFGVQVNMDELQGAQDSALAALDDGAFKEYQDLVNQIKDLEIKAVVAREGGDIEGAERYSQSAEALTGSMQAARSSMSEEEFTSGRARYRAALSENIEDPRVNEKNSESYADHVRGRYQDTMGTIARTASKAEEIKELQAKEENRLNRTIASSARDLNEAEVSALSTRAAAEAARKNVIDLRPGEVISNRDVRNNNKNIEEAREESRRANTASQLRSPAVAPQDPVAESAPAEPVATPAPRDPQPSQSSRTARGIPTEVFSTPGEQQQSASESPTAPLSTPSVDRATSGAEATRQLPVVDAPAARAPRSAPQAPAPAAAPRQVQPTEDRTAQANEAQLPAQPVAPAARPTTPAQAPAVAPVAVPQTQPVDNSATREREARADSERRSREDAARTREAASARQAAESRRAEERRSQDAAAAQADRESQRQQNAEAERARRAEADRVKAARDAAASRTRAEADASIREIDESAEGNDRSISQEVAREQTEAPSSENRENSDSQIDRMMSLRDTEQSNRTDDSGDTDPLARGGNPFRGR